MSKMIKAMIAAEYHERFAGVDSACVVDLSGLNVHEQETLRSSLRAKSARLEVVKNSLVRRAFRQGPLEPLGNALNGPCALVTSTESLIDAAKVLVEAAKEFDRLELKQAILEGDPDLVNVTDVAKLKSQVELISELAMLITSPGRALVGCLGSPQSKIAGCLKTMIEKAA